MNQNRTVVPMSHQAVVVTSSNTESEESELMLFLRERCMPFTGLSGELLGIVLVTGCFIAYVGWFYYQRTVFREASCQYKNERKRAKATRTGFEVVLTLPTPQLADSPLADTRGDGPPHASGFPFQNVIQNVIQKTDKNNRFNNDDTQEMLTRDVETVAREDGMFVDPPPSLKERYLLPDHPPALPGDGRTQRVFFFDLTRISVGMSAAVAINTLVIAQLLLASLAKSDVDQGMLAIDVGGAMPPEQPTLAGSMPPSDLVAGNPPPPRTLTSSKRRERQLNALRNEVFLPLPTSFDGMSWWSAIFISDVIIGVPLAIAFLKLLSGVSSLILKLIREKRFAMALIEERRLAADDDEGEGDDGVDDDGAKNFDASRERSSYAYQLSSVVAGALPDCITTPIQRVCQMIVVSGRYNFDEDLEVYNPRCSLFWEGLRKELQEERKHRVRLVTSDNQIVGDENVVGSQQHPITTSSSFVSNTLHSNTLNPTAMESVVAKGCGADMVSVRSEPFAPSVMGKHVLMELEACGNADGSNDAIVRFEGSVTRVDDAEDKGQCDLLSAFCAHPMLSLRPVLAFFYSEEEIEALQDSQRMRATYDDDLWLLHTHSRGLNEKAGAAYGGGTFSLTNTSIAINKSPSPLFARPRRHSHHHHGDGKSFTALIPSIPPVQHKVNERSSLLVPAEKELEAVQQRNYGATSDVQVVVVPPSLTPHHTAFTPITQTMMMPSGLYDEATLAKMAEEGESSGVASAHTHGPNADESDEIVSPVFGDVPLLPSAIGGSVLSRDGVEEKVALHVSGENDNAGSHSLPLAQFESTTEKERRLRREREEMRKALSTTQVKSSSTAKKSVPASSSTKVEDTVARCMPRLSWLFAQTCAWVLCIVLSRFVVVGVTFWTIGLYKERCMTIRDAVDRYYMCYAHEEAYRLFEETTVQYSDVRAILLAQLHEEDALEAKRRKESLLLGTISPSTAHSLSDPSSYDLTPERIMKAYEIAVWRAHVSLANDRGEDLLQVQIDDNVKSRTDNKATPSKKNVKQNHKTVKSSLPSIKDREKSRAYLSPAQLEVPPLPLSFALRSPMISIAYIFQRIADSMSCDTRQWVLGGGMRIVADLFSLALVDTFNRFT